MFALNIITPLINLTPLNTDLRENFMTDLGTKLNELNDKISETSNSIISIHSLLSALVPDNGDFVNFFSRIYSASIEPSSLDRPTHQWAMLFTYYQDLCENMPDEMASSFSDLLEKNEMTMEILAGYCEDVIEHIKAERKPLEQERSNIVFALARASMKQAA